MQKQMRGSGDQELQPLIGPARIEFKDFGLHHVLCDEGIIVHPDLEVSQAAPAR